MHEFFLKFNEYRLFSIFSNPNLYYIILYYRVSLYDYEFPDVPASEYII